MRRLQDFQVVSLSAGKGNTPCRVVAMGGDAAVLHPEEQRRVNDLALPAKATLGFDYGGHPVMLHGRVAAGPIADTLRFHVTDDVAIPELRLAPRLSATFDVDVAMTSETGDAAVPVRRLQATDISAGGTFVRGLAGVAARDRVSLTLHLPGLDEPLETIARVVRTTPAGAATAFEALEADDAAILEALIYAVRREFCRRASEDAARRARLGRPQPRAA